MSNKKDIKRKKRKKQQKENIERKNLKKIQEIKSEDIAKRNDKKAKRAKNRTEKANIEKKDLYREEINLSDDVESAVDIIKEVNDENINLEENKKSKEQKNNKKEKKKPISKNKIKVLKKLAIVIILVLLIVLGFIIYLAVRPKFQNVTIELGTSEISAQDFLVSDIYKNGASFTTDLETIDLNKVQEVDIVLNFKGKEETVKLNIVDTTAPTVVFKDIMGYLDYVPNPDDFIESKDDLSEMTVEFITVPEFTDYGTYPVEIKVSDVYGNETTGTCNLMITWLLSDVEIELGSSFSVEDVVIDAERFGSIVPESEIAKVNTMVIGTYEIYVDIDGKTYTSKVVVQDTTPPDLVLQDITIWNDETVSSYTDFIVSANDISGEVTTECLTTIDYTIIGNQTVTIKATDVNGNVNEQNATLKIKKDTTGPTIYGLSNLTVSKHTTINYDNGVYAVDDKDGNVALSGIDTSSVNTSVAGTYYATYYATDSSGNVSSSKRKIIVNWDSEDVNAKIDSFYSSYCAGMSADGITNVVRSRIRYSASSYGDRNSNIYYGLSNGSGNCIVHAYILQALLNKAGYSCQIVRTSDGAHYWNYANGCHYDSTPGGNHLLVAGSEEEKLSETWFATRAYTADQFIYSY